MEGGGGVEEGWRLSDKKVTKAKTERKTDGEGGEGMEGRRKGIQEGGREGVGRGRQGGREGVGRGRQGGREGEGSD